MDDARGRREILQIAQRLVGGDQRGEGAPLVEYVAIEMQLERTDAGHDVDHARQRERLELGHQRMNADTQLDIEHDRAVFDQDIAIALLRSEEHTSELQSLMRISYAVF